MLTEVTGVPESALPVEEFRAHLRLGTGFADDSVQDPLLSAYLRAAIAAVEGRTGKALLARDFRLTLAHWREAAAQELPVAPVASIGAVTLTDRAGATETVEPARYRLVADTHRPQLASTGWLLPRVPAGGSVAIDFTAGFGPAWEDVPVDLRQAVLLLAAHYHEQRHQLEEGPSAMPFGVMALIERWRNLRLLGGGGAVRAINPTRRLVLEAAVRVPDGAGGWTETWEALGTLWADIRPGAGRRLADEFEARASQPCRAYVRGAPVGAPSRPQPGQRFREGARLYAIRAVTEADRLGTWLVCVCEEEVPA